MTDHHLADYTRQLTRRGNTNTFEDGDNGVWTIDAAGISVRIHRQMSNGQTIEYAGTLAGPTETPRVERSASRSTPTASGDGTRGSSSRETRAVEP